MLKSQLLSFFLSLQAYIFLFFIVCNFLTTPLCSRRVNFRSFNLMNLITTPHWSYRECYSLDRLTSSYFSQYAMFSLHIMSMQGLLQIIQHNALYHYTSLVFQGMLQSQYAYIFLFFLVCNVLPTPLCSCNCRVKFRSYILILFITTHHWSFRDSFSLYMLTSSYFSQYTIFSLHHYVHVGLASDHIA